ncbi:MAG: TROVE domain-containing protein [Aureispira sp.]|nr:TROVE domain-containing protein [Aureispira sp.]
MALFNKVSKKKSKKTKNLAGGQAYKMSAEMKLASMLLTSFAQDQYYRSAKDTFKDLVNTLPQVDPEFAAKAAIFARTEYGMRSITHVLAAELAAYASGKAWSKSFYDKVIFRPDDMLEIMAYYYAKGGKTLPNAMKKGFAKSFDRFDAYQLAKYRGNSKSVKLIDVVNLVHPKPTGRNEKALKNLVDDELRSQNTWEAKLTKAGQTAKSDTEKAELKKAAWAEMIESGKIGYFALLRNLRNIAEQAPAMIDKALAILTDPKRIQSPRNLVMPFRYLVAFKQFNKEKTAIARKIAAALDKAIEISCANAPAMENTLIVVDNSGSMCSPVAGSEHMQCSEMGAAFGMILAKNSNADLMEFGTNARYIQYNLRDSVTSFAADFHRKNKVGHGTDFKSIFKTAKKAYDRIVIFSDMQGWMGYYAPGNSLKDYQKHTGANPYIYSYDLRGYGTMQFPENRVFCLAGFSDKVFDIMQLLETDPRALVNKIKKVQL